MGDRACILKNYKLIIYYYYYYRNSYFYQTFKSGTWTLGVYFNRLNNLSPFGNSLYHVVLRYKYDFTC